jgi:hypothetical protein
MLHRPERSVRSDGRAVGMAYNALEYIFAALLDTPPDGGFLRRLCGPHNFSHCGRPLKL